MLPRFLLVVIFVAVIAHGLLWLYATLFGLPDGGEPVELPRDDAELESGAFLHRILTERFACETEAWALEMAARVAARLQADRPPGERLVVEVLWTQEFGAFTAPGRWVYLSRRLMERCRCEDAVALVVAHEIAHHDLGHMRAAPPLLWRAAQQWHGPRWESEADAHGLRLCLAAGYDPRRCLRLFDVLEEHALDVGDPASVFGPERAFDEALAGAPGWRVEALRWAHARRRGYVPLRERRAALAGAFAGEGGGARG